MLEMRIRQERPCSPSYPAARRPCSPFLEPSSAVTKAFSDVCSDRRRRRTISDSSSFGVDGSSPSGDSFDRRYSETHCDTATSSSSSSSYFSPSIKSERSYSPTTPPQSASESSSSSCSPPTNGATKRDCSPSSLHPPKKKWIHCYLAVGDSSEDGSSFQSKSSPSPLSLPSPSPRHTSPDLHRSPHHHHTSPGLHPSPPHHPSTPTHHTTPTTQYSPLNAASSPGSGPAVAPSTPHPHSRSPYSPILRTSHPSSLRFSSSGSVLPGAPQTSPSRLNPYAEEGRLRTPSYPGAAGVPVTNSRGLGVQPPPSRLPSQAAPTTLTPSSTYAVVNGLHQSNGFTASGHSVVKPGTSRLLALGGAGGGSLHQQSQQQQHSSSSSSVAFGRPVTAGGSNSSSSLLSSSILPAGGRAALTSGTSSVRNSSNGASSRSGLLLDQRQQQRPHTTTHSDDSSSHKQQGHHATVGEGLNGASRLNGSVFRSLPDHRPELSASQTSYLQQTTHYAAAAPAPPAPLPREDSAKRRQGNVTTPSREVHNKLEKYRRAHLKECFELLRRQISNMDDKKVSNQNILKAAYKCINSLKRKERDYEHEMERLAREKISHQQHLASLKKELAARWDHIDFSTLLPDMATLDHHRDKETKSTTTASEQPDLMDEDPSPLASLPRPGGVHTATHFDNNYGGRPLPNGIHGTSGGSGVILQYHRGPSTAVSTSIGTESLLSSALPGHRSSFLGNGVHRSPVPPMVVPSSPVTLVRATAANHMTVSPAALSYGKPLTSRQSPVVTYTSSEPHGLTSIVTYTPQPSPQPGIVGTCTHHISPQPTPVMTYTPQPSPQSPSSGSLTTQTTHHTFSVAPANTILTSATNSICKIQQRDSYQDPNQPLNLSTNTGIIAPLRSNASLPSVHLSPAGTLVETADGVLSNIQQSAVQSQTSSPSWFVQQHHQASTNDQLQKVELKIVDGVTTAQIIRPLHTMSKVVSMPSMDGMTEAHRLRQPNISSAQIVAKLSPSTVTFNPTHIPQNISFCPPNSTFSLQQSSSTASIPSSHSPHVLAPKTHPSHHLNQGMPVQISMASGGLTTSSDASGSSSIISSAGGEGYTVRLASSGTTFVHPGSGSNTHHLQNATALMPIVQSGGGLHHIPVRIAASGGGLVNIITPELAGGYKLISTDHAFSNGNKPITIALPQEEVLSDAGASDSGKAGGGGVMVAVSSRNGVSALHVAMPSATRCLRLSSDKPVQGLNGPAAPLNLTTSPTPVFSSSSDHQQHGATLRLTPNSVMPPYLPFTPTNGMSQLMPGMMVTPVVVSPAMSGSSDGSAKVSSGPLPTPSGDCGGVGAAQSANGGGKAAALVLPGPYSGHFPGAALVVVSSAAVEPRTFAASPAIIASHATSKTTAIYATQTN